MKVIKLSSALIYACLLVGSAQAKELLFQEDMLQKTVNFPTRSMAVEWANKSAIALGKAECEMMDGLASQVQLKPAECTVTKVNNNFSSNQEYRCMVSGTLQCDIPEVTKIPMFTVESNYFSYIYANSKSKKGREVLSQLFKSDDVEGSSSSERAACFKSALESVASLKKDPEIIKLMEDSQQQSGQVHLAINIYRSADNYNTYINRLSIKDSDSHELVSKYNNDYKCFVDKNDVINLIVELKKTAPKAPKKEINDLFDELSNNISSSISRNIASLENACSID